MKSQLKVNEMLKKDYLLKLYRTGKLKKIEQIGIIYLLICENENKGQDQCKIIIKNIKKKFNKFEIKSRNTIYNKLNELEEIGILIIEQREERYKKETIIHLNMEKNISKQENNIFIEFKNKYIKQEELKLFENFTAYWRKKEEGEKEEKYIKIKDFNIHGRWDFWKRKNEEFRNTKAKSEKKTENNIDIEKIIKNNIK